MSADRAREPELCPLCRTYGHSATCPSQLATREQRIEYVTRVASIEHREDSLQRCLALGISDDEFAEGYRLYRAALKREWIDQRSGSDRERRTA